MPDLRDTDSFNPDRDDAGDDSGLLEDDFGSDQGSDGPSGDTHIGTGLTDPERQLADEQNRRAERRTALDRFERFARDSSVGGGGGASAERDALAVIEAAERFGELEEDEAVKEERRKISAALEQHVGKEAPALSEYNFYGIITKQGTTNNGNITLLITVPWEFHEEVFRALETMPFRAMFTLRQAAPVDE